MIPTDTGPAPAGPLAGLTVIDLSRALAGPHAGMMLGDLGARVLKIERPGAGDDTRCWGPPFVGPEGAREATYFLSCNRNKASVALDLKTADGRAALTELLRDADVLIENFRPGVLDRLGFDGPTLDALNPGLVTLSISGFGHDGPESHRSGYDQILQGEAGLMSLTGSGPDDPQRVGVPIADLLSGIYGIVGVLAALTERARTGRGQIVRTSLLAALIGVHAFQGSRHTVAGETPAAQGNHHPSIAPYGLFRCADGHVQISVGNDTLWNRFAERFGLDATDTRYADNAARVQHRPELIADIEGAFAGIGREDLLLALHEAGIPAGRVRDLAEVYAWEQVRSQGLIVDVEHPTLGRIELPGPPLRFFDAADGRERTRTAHTAPPLLGADTDAVLGALAERSGS